ncbi:hypothetical protein [Nocardia sp. NRRL S-836]|uniref:hypothetical protein n=1 Tax=Nocardia sp. NRRL S-836 TaxID=1519492 RepID=UPI0006AE5AF9|nr:hypothetical protein [Nocardia sp. NRRL S-836]KOV81962.1 hypothetical protein ADL03_26570 [Nocardia sp. NRRL S-836]
MKRVLALVLLLSACGGDPAPPKFTDTDPCTLLRGGDAGELTSTAKGERECTFAFGSTTVTLKLLEAKFEQESARLQTGGGYGAVVEDRPMTRRCASSACEAVVQVREGELLGLSVTKQGEDDNVLGQTTQGLALKALQRLPR